jgi:hypothetical protein
MASERVLGVERLTHFEGYARNPGHAWAPHGWCVDQAGRVADITPGWTAGSGEYVGLPGPLVVGGEHLFARLFADRRAAKAALARLNASGRAA